MNKTQKRGKSIIISAPSGSGKTSIVRYLLKNEASLEFSISATSRAQRKGEKNGIDYYFMSADEFRRRIDNNEFIEWEEVYKDVYYGTLHSELERIWANKKHIVFDVDVIGGLRLKSAFGSGAVSIFIRPPGIDELRKRLIGRGTDSPEEIDIRIAKAEKEINEAGRFDIIIVNDDLDRARKKTLKACKSFIDE